MYTSIYINSTQKMHVCDELIIFFFLFLKGSERRDHGLASIVTLASSLDYASSKSTLKLLLPLVSALNRLSLFFFSPHR